MILVELRLSATAVSSRDPLPEASLAGRIGIAVEITPPTLRGRERAARSRRGKGPDGESHQDTEILNRRQEFRVMHSSLLKMSLPWGFKSVKGHGDGTVTRGARAVYKCAPQLTRRRACLPGAGAAISEPKGLYHDLVTEKPNVPQHLNDVTS